MKTLIPSNPATIKALADQLKKARGRPEYRHIQCVLIRATLGSTAAEIATLLGWSKATVHILHSRYAREGKAVFEVRARGGRNRENLSKDEESAFLAPFIEKAKAGGILVVAEIHEAYCKRIGKQAALSTTYRLLANHGWRKLVPRPRHPKADPKAQRRFKKNSASS